MGEASQLPDRIGPYQVYGYLGAGGMGHVYKAVAPDGQVVAVKVIHDEHVSDPRFRARFQREAEAARRVPRFCTAEVLGFAFDGPVPYIATEYIAGPTLDAAIGEGGPWRAANLEQLGVSVAAALTAIHGAGIVHRDLKPSNVLLSPTGPRVVDFGIARADSAERLTATGQHAGTPAFMAPEVFLGQPATAAVDVFAWGGLMVFAATGRYPFGTGLLPAVGYRIVYTEPDLTGLDGRLRETVAAALTKDPAGRPDAEGLLRRLGVGASPTDTQRAVSRQLAGWVPPTTGSGEDQAAPPQTQEPVAPAPRRRRWRVAALAAVPLVLLAVAALTLQLLGDRPADRDDPARGQTFAIELNTLVQPDLPAPGAGRLRAGGDQETYTFTGQVGQSIALTGVACEPATGFSPDWSVTTPSGQLLDEGRLCGTDTPATLSEEGTYRLTVVEERAAGTFSFVLLDRDWPPESMQGTEGVVAGLPSFGGQIGHYQEGAGFLRFLDDHELQKVYLDVLLPAGRFPELRDEAARAAAFANAEFGIYDPSCRPAPPGQPPTFEDCGDVDLNLVDIDGATAGRQFTRDADGWRLKGFFAVVGVVDQQTGTVIRRITAIPSGEAVE